MKIGIVGNFIAATDGGVIENFVRFLSKNGYHTTVFSVNEQIDGVDVLIVFGGDGAILHAATVAASKGIKIIGINYGHLGFLAEYERGEEEKVLELLDQLQTGNCRIFKRSMLQVKLGGEIRYALNEIAVHRYINDENPLKTQILKLCVRFGDTSDTFSGDGVLISTPTGSTGYSLSAGGAILTPEVPALLLTPICAFSLGKRPIVFPESEIFAVQAERGDALILADGKGIGYLKEGERIEISKAPFCAEFPIRAQSDFFAKIKTKLN